MKDKTGRPMGERPSVSPFYDLEKRSLHIPNKSIKAVMISDGALDYGLSFYAEVTTYTDTTHFKASGLANMGAGFFVPVAGSPYEIYVVQADAAAPEGQMTPVVAYTTTDGTFQHAAFSGGNLAVGDKVLIVHPFIALLRDVVDDTWDEVLTGATHNVATSAGRRLRDIAGNVIRAETAQAGDATHITLDADASGTNDIYNLTFIVIVGGTGAGQGRHIMDYVGASKIAEVNPAWVVNPSSDSEYVIYGAAQVMVHEIDADGLAQINAEVDTALSDYDPPTKTEMDTAHALLATEAKQDIIDGVVDAVLVDTADIQPKIGTPAADLAADIAAIKVVVDAIPTSIVPLSSDWKGNFNWDTSEYTTDETDISALFSTNLAIATRRKYSVKLDLTNVEADASFVSLYIAVKEKIDGTNYRAIDRKLVEKADIAALAEPGIIIDIPATSENIQITMKMTTALAGDATIYYAVVKEHLE